jgi:hypothetical protein
MFFSSFKMAFSSLFLCTLLVATPYARADVNVYTAVLKPFGDNSQALGKVTIFSDATSDGGIVAYAGNAQRLPNFGNLATNATCAEVNGK